jgi:predicted MFS family arabinose efflux permease
VGDVTTKPRHSLGVLTALLAMACGLTVANLYYAQPLLALISRSFHVGEGTATVVVTMTQIGYALGLLLVLPVGDLLENRVLVTRTLVGTAAALAVAGAAPDYGVFLAACVLVGLTSVVAQILVPLAAHLAPRGQEGRFVGRVMSGLLLGILLARTVSSLLAEAAGWRAIFFVSAGTGCCRPARPSTPPATAPCSPRSGGWCGRSRSCGGSRCPRRVCSLRSAPSGPRSPTS